MKKIILTTLLCAGLASAAETVIIKVTLYQWDKLDTNAQPRPIWKAYITNDATASQRYYTANCAFIKIPTNAPAK